MRRRPKQLKKKQQRRMMRGRGQMKRLLINPMDPQKKRRTKRKRETRKRKISLPCPPA